MNSNYKDGYNYSGFKTAITAFIGDLELKFQTYLHDNFPVFIRDTGDNSYFMNKKFEEVTNKELIDSVPRGVLVPSTIQPDLTQNTYPYNCYKFKIDNKNYKATGRRVTNKVPFDFNLVSSNYVKYLEHYEFLLSLFSYPNPLTFEYNGNTYQAIYTITGNGSEGKPPLEASSNSRNYVNTVQIELEVQLLFNRLGSIDVVDSGYGVNIELNANTQNGEKQDKIIIPKVRR